MGLVIAKGVALYAGWATVVTPFSRLLSSGVSVGIGLVIRHLPATRAARLDPIESLRYEWRLDARRVGLSPGGRNG